MTASFGSIIVLIILLIRFSFRFLCLVYDFHSPAGISTHCCSRRKFEENVFDSRAHSTLSSKSGIAHLAPVRRGLQFSMQKSYSPAVFAKQRRAESCFSVHDLSISRSPMQHVL